MATISIMAPATDVRDITPSDSDDFETQYDAAHKCCRGIYVGKGGEIVIVTPYGTTATLYGAQAGSTIPIQARQVKETNTTAQNLIALF